MRREPLLSPFKSGYAPPQDDADLTRPTATTAFSPVATAGLRKKGTGVRTWLLLDSTGRTQVVEAGKQAIMRRTGLPARDLRMLDPFLSYPSTVLGRERAIVINLEHIKAIITAQEALILNFKDPSATPFVEQLQLRIQHFHRATKSQLKETDGEQDFENQDESKVLPFEFVTLEACLEASCSCLDNEATTLEQETHPALDKLTSKVSTINLERVRQIKSRLVAITGRVQKVRNELEHLLDDDEDMAEMYLTDKMFQQNIENFSVSSINERDGMDNGVLQSDMDDKHLISTTISFKTKRIPAEISLEANGGSTNYEDDIQDIDNNPHRIFGMPNVLCRDSHGTDSSSTHNDNRKHLDVEELEMLLEAYFVQIDGTLSKLSTLREYVDDTEDYITIMLDDRQNQLLHMRVVIITVAIVINAFGIVASLFSMSLGVEILNNLISATQKWVYIACGGTIGTIFLYVFAIAWYKYKGIIH